MANKKHEKQPIPAKEPQRPAFDPKKMDEPKEPSAFPSEKEPPEGVDPEAPEPGIDVPADENVSPPWPERD